MPPLPPDGPGDGELERRLRRLRVRNRPAAPPDTASLDADVKPKVSALMDSAYVDNVPLTVNEIGRTQARQDSLYGIGRQPNDHRPPVTWTQNSQHTRGRAVDFRVNNDPTGADPGYGWLRRTAPKVGLDVPIPVNDPGHVEDLGPDQTVPADSTLEQRLAALRAQPPQPQPTLAPDVQAIHNRRKGFGQEPNDALDIGKRLGGLGLRTVGGMAKDAWQFVSPTQMLLHPLHNFETAKNFITAPAHGIADWDKLTTQAAEGEDLSRGEIAERAANTALSVLGPLEMAARGGRGMLNNMRGRETPGTVTPTQRAEPRATVPQDVPAERVQSTAEAIQGLGEHAEQVRPAREAFDQTAPPVVTNPRNNPLSQLDEHLAQLREEENEAARLTLVPDKTLEQRARAKELNDRADQRMLEMPPPPPVEQSAFRGNDEPPPIPTDIIERERQRPELEASGRIPRQLERRRPGERRLDETQLIDEEAEQRRGERRQPETSRSIPERRDLGTRPVPQGDERRASTPNEETANAALSPEQQGSPFYIARELDRQRAEQRRGYDPEPPTQTTLPEPNTVDAVKQAQALIGKDRLRKFAEQIATRDAPNDRGIAYESAARTVLDLHRAGALERTMAKLDEASPAREVPSTADVQPPTNVPLPPRERRAGPHRPDDTRAYTDAENYRPGTVPGEPPVEGERRGGLDVSALDARIQAQRAANAKLEEQANAIPLKPRQTAAERLRAIDADRGASKEKRAMAGAAENAKQRRARMQLGAEAQRIQAKIDAAQAELSGVPTRGRPGPDAIERASLLNQTIADLKQQLLDVNTRRARPLDANRPPEKPPSGGLTGESGAVPLGPIAPKITEAIQRALSPTSVSVEAEHAGRILRANLGETARNYEIAAEALNQFRKSTPLLTTPEGVDLSERIETGQAVPQEYVPVARELRRALDDARNQIQALGTGKLQHFIDNYLGHIWEQPKGGLLDRVLGRRPLAGPKSFLRHRTIPTIAEGIQQGKVPLTANLVDMQLIKLREMHRYLMAERMMTELKDNGLVELVPGMHRPPDGYVRIADPIAQVFGKPVVRNVGGKPVAAPVKLGEWWAPEPVARLLNNHLAPGLRGNALFDTYLGIGNFLNQVQLGFTGFHLGFTTLDVALSKGALGMSQLFSGRPLRAAGSFAKAAVFPVSTITNYIRGSTLLREYLKPGTQGGDFMQLANSITEAGGRVRMDTFYKNSSVERFFDAWHKGRPLGVARRALPALIEAAARPIMEHIVPRQKLGVFADLARHELERLGSNVSPDATRAAMQRAWDSVDNRMGQLVYDNLFWNKAIKDLGMASVRSLGWNLGTLREIGGGLADIARGKGPAQSHRAAYVIAMPLLVGLYGGVLHYLFTGQAPETLKDWYFPRTGRKNDDGTEERVQLPTYMRDISHVSRGGAWQMAKNKLHPLLSVVGDMLNNEDFYGNMIRNPDDPMVKQLQQEVTYALKQYQPLGVQYALREREQAQPAGAVAGQFFGLTPAPRDVVRSPAQNKMHEYHQRRGETLTPEQADERTQLRPVYRALRQHDTAPFADALRQRQLTMPQARDMVRRALTDPNVNSFDGLTLEEAEHVWSVATPAERQVLRPYFFKKMQNAGQAGHLDEVRRALDELRTQP